MRPFTHFIVYGSASCLCGIISNNGLLILITRPSTESFGRFSSTMLGGPGEVFRFNVYLHIWHGLALNGPKAGEARLWQYCISYLASQSVSNTSLRNSSTRAVGNVMPHQSTAFWTRLPHYCPWKGIYMPNRSAMTGCSRPRRLRQP